MTTKHFSWLMFFKKKGKCITEIVLSQNACHVRIHLFCLAKTAKRHFYLNLELVMQRPDKTKYEDNQSRTAGKGVFFCYFV